jgi:hypothetical protein
VDGPSTATNTAVAIFDGTTGKLIKNTGVTIDGSNNVSGVVQLNATTLDATNIEVTNLKAKDGTAAGSIADSTGVVTLASSVLTTTDINGGTIDGAVIGGSTAAAGTFTTLGATGVATFSAGTASAPAITTTGDTNTGIFFPAADTIAFAEGGAEAMRITSSGNVGIGTSSPSFKLDIQQNTAQITQRLLNTATSTNSIATLIISGNNDATKFQIDVDGLGSAFGAGALLGMKTNHFLAFQTNNTERMRIDSSGNVGIGTSSPSYTFQVTNNSNANATSAVTNSTAGTSSVARFLAISDAGNASLGMASTSYTDIAGAADSAFISAANASGGIVFANDAVVQMRLDTSGNLGLGVTPSAWGTGKAFEIGSGGNGIWSGSGYTSLLQNTAFTSGAYRYVTSQTAARLDIEAGTFKWYTAPSGTAGDAISFTQAMTLDASGNLLVGVTSAAGNRFYVRTATETANSIYSDNGVNSGFIVRYAPNTTLIGNDFNNPLAFLTNNTERMRIDSSGNVLVGTTSSWSSAVKTQIYASGGTSCLSLTSDDNANVDQAYFRTPSGIAGLIRTNTLTTTYATSSDYRLKENVAPMQNALATVAALKPCTYTWKVDGSAGQGFIAHELQEVVPDCVTGEKDAVDAEGKPRYQGVDTSFLVGVLTAAIQEQQALIQDLTTRLTALEGN